jgi:hypothetical protein
MNIAGPMSDMANLPDEQGYFNDLQLEQNQEQRIAGLPPESASNDYYQDVMQPNRDQSVYPFGAQEGMTEGEFGQQAEENLEGFDPMRLPDESGSMPEPWITQEKIDAQQARIRAAEERRRAQRQTQQNNTSNKERTTQQSNKRSNTQGYTAEEIANATDANGNFNQEWAEELRREIEAERESNRLGRIAAKNYEGSAQQKRDLADAQKQQRESETSEIKSLGVPVYGNYKTKEDLFKAMYKGHVKSPGEIGFQPRKYNDDKEGERRTDKEQALKIINQEYENWLLSQEGGSDSSNSGGVKNTGTSTMVNGVSYPIFNIDGKTYYKKGQGYYPIKKMGGPTFPMAQTGLFTTNPDLVGLSDIDLINAQTAPEVSGSVNNATGNWWSPSPNMPTIQETGMVQPEQMTIDPNQQYTQQMKREYDPRGAAVKFKVKNMYNVDFERGINVGNALINRGLAIAGERGDRNRRAQMANNLTADNLYSSTNSRDRGTYETNSGLFRPDEKGFKGVIKHGGAIYKTGGVTYMSADQVKKFLAEGGELEFV